MITPKENYKFDTNKINLLKNNLDNYKRPREVEFRDALPKNSLRKILKKDLRKEAVEKMKDRLAAIAEN